jgi:cysteine desulfurase
MSEAFTYLDHAATTPMRPEAVQAMMPYLTEQFANPSGSHRFAREVRKAVDDAREVIAAGLGCEPGEVVFTGCGTESDNLAVAGVIERTGGTAVTTAAEHHAVLHAVEHVGGVVIGVLPDGSVDLVQLEAALNPNVRLVSVMLVNNEVGTIAPLQRVTRIVSKRAPQAVVHTDAVQAVCWLDIATHAKHAHLIAISAHKFGGPKGVGALVVRKGTALAPQLLGGGQERDVRSGTHNVAGIVAMAEALRLTVAERDETNRRVTALRDRLVDGLIAAIPGTTETVARDRKIPGSAHVCFDNVENEALLYLLDRAGIAASAASACASGAMDPSHVLAAMGVPRERALGALRLTLGRTTTDADIDHALSVLPDAVAQCRRVGIPAKAAS